MRKISLIVQAVMMLTVCMLLQNCDRTEPDAAFGKKIKFLVGDFVAWNESDGDADFKESAEDPASVAVLPTHGPIVLSDKNSCEKLYIHISRNKPQLMKTKSVDGMEAYGSFGVFGYSYDGKWEGIETPDYMYNTETVRDGSYWSPKDAPALPEDERTMRFFAYAPYNADGLSFSGRSVPGVPVLTMDIPSDVSSQEDIVVSYTGEMLTAEIADGPVELQFRHVLTSVRFVTADNVLKGEITGVRMKGVYGKGTYAMGDASWSDLGEKTDYYRSFTADADYSGSAETTDSETLFMIPQTLPEDAVIEVEITDDLTGTSRILSARMGGQQWLTGEAVTYKISTSDIDMDTEFSVKVNGTVDNEGGSIEYNVISYAVVGQDNSFAALEWTAEFVDENGQVINRPEWVTGFTDSGEGGREAERLSMSIQEQEGVTCDGNENLRNAPAVSGFNLSNSAGAESVENTANCYLINAPGSYKLPLVYGNAVKNGLENTVSYKSSVSGDKVLGTFINHLGNAITDPYIYNNVDCVPSDAVLVWQDAENLISDVRLSDDGHWIEFNADASTITQGNAVVAVRDASDKIMWSWHLWVTDYVLGTELKTVQYNGEYSFMPVDLGYCDSPSKLYEGRVANVRFTQVGTGETVTVSFVQEGVNLVEGLGTVPFYQWGRKDPMLPSDGLNNANKTWYDASGVASAEMAYANWETGEANIVNGILNPFTFSANRYMDYTYYNLWATNNDSDSEELQDSDKTVYDPSPVGFKVPVMNPFRSFTKSGNRTSDHSQVNGVWDAGALGWYFDCTENGEPSTVFFSAASGSRDYYDLGEIMYVGSTSSYWSCVPLTGVHGTYLALYEKNVYPNNYFYRASGFCVRPVAE